MSFYSPSNLDNQNGADFMRLRSPNLYQTKHAAFIGICGVDKQKVYIVLGTKTEPVVAPLGVKHFKDSDDPAQGYKLISIALNDDMLKSFVTSIDSSVLGQLAAKSESIFHEKYTVSELLKMKYYKPCMYQDNNGLDPLLGAKFADNCMVLDSDMVPTDEEVMPGAEVCCVFSIPSLCFKAPNSCKLTVRCEKIMIIVNGKDADQAVNDFQFQ